MGTLEITANILCAFLYKNEQQFSQDIICYDK